MLAVDEVPENVVGSVAEDDINPPLARIQAEIRGEAVDWSLSLLPDAQSQELSHAQSQELSPTQNDVASITANNVEASVPKIQKEIQREADNHSFSLLSDAQSQELSPATQNSKTEHNRLTEPAPSTGIDADEELLKRDDVQTIVIAWFVGFFRGATAQLKTCQGLRQKVLLSFSDFLVQLSEHSL